MSGSQLSPRHDWSEAQFLAEGFAGNLTILRELQFRCQLTNDQTAQALMVSPHTYRRWRCDRKPNPTAVKLLAVLAGHVPWPGWDGWEVHQGYLFPPGFRKNGILPTEFWNLPIYRSLARDFDLKLRELQAVIDHVQGSGEYGACLVREAQAHVKAKDGI